jgi:hypothetical protein
MKHMHATVLGIAMSLLALTGYAAEDPVGQWKGEGPRGEFTITIAKDADGALTGQMVTGRGANDLSNVKLDGADLSFTNLLEFNDRSFELNFAGKIDGNSFTGTLSTPRGENPVSLTRAITGVQGLVGTWKLTGESQFGTLEHTFTLNKDETATYGSSGEISKVTNLKVDGKKVTFNMTVYGGPQAYDVAFDGSYDDDALTGDMISSGSSFAKLTAPRSKGLAQWAGTWKLIGESRYGPLEHILTVAADGKAKYGSGGEVSEVSNVKIDGNNINFNMTVFGGGGSYDVAFEGKFGGDNLTGDVMSNGASFAAVKASKE